MKNKQFIFSLFLFIIFFNTSVNALVGQWKTYLAYTDVENVTQSVDKVFALGYGSLYSVDKQDLSNQTYTKLTGLSDNNISFIKYSDDDQALFIVYQNSDIDLITSQGISNLPDLFQKTMTGNKGINNIYFNNGFAYLSADFGVLKVNISKKEFSDTYIIGPNATSVVVNGTTILQDSIYASTSSSIFRANLNVNLSNYANWNTIANIPESTVANKSILTFDNKLFLLKTDGKIYVRDNQTQIFSLFRDSIISMNLSQKMLNLTASQSVYSYTNSSSFISVATAFPCSMAVYDQSLGQFFIAAQSKGLATLNKQNTTVSFSMPSGPALNDPFTMKFVGQKLYVTTTGTWVSGSPTTGVPGGVMIYDGNNWINITQKDIPTTNNNTPFTDLLNIAVDPNDSNHYFVGAWGRGLYEFKNNAFYQRYNYTNSLIQTPYGRDDSQIIDGLTYDKNNNLWMTQSVVSDAIKVIKADGTWKSFYFPIFTGYNTVQRILIDENNFKWINTPRAGPGLFIFDDNGTIDDTSDDRSIFLRSFIDQDGYSFTSSSFRCMAEDNTSPTKQIWVGTANGPIIFQNSINAFDNTFTCTRVKIPRNDGTDLADYLLANESVNAIAVDGANRKWLATNTSGVYLVSPDGTSTVYQFTAENSPLLSDNVLSVAINPITGEVFFGTDQGIISYMGNATAGSDAFSNVYAYPNPVRQDYQGLISIVGLETESDVKITDVSGNIIYEAMSNGGMITWDGKNITGKRVNTGVYLAICTASDGSKSTIVKILVINK
jgi:hypothetical protein